MIYFLAGNDYKNKNLRRKTLLNKLIPTKISSDEISREILLDYANRNSLFGDKIIVVLENLLKIKDLVLNIEDWTILKESETLFICVEESIFLTEEKKYKKYAIIERFLKKEEKKDTGKDVFAICDAYTRKNKIGAWVLYREAIERGVAPENISGVLFWKIKTMILNKDKNFKEELLKKQSSDIVSLHHRAHKGEIDFVVGLEQFILSSLSN